MLKKIISIGILGIFFSTNVNAIDYNNLFGKAGNIDQKQVIENKIFSLQKELVLKTSNQLEKIKGDQLEKILKIIKEIDVDNILKTKKNIKTYGYIDGDINIVDINKLLRLSQQGQYSFQFHLKNITNTDFVSGDFAKFSSNNKFSFSDSYSNINTDFNFSSIGLVEPYKSYNSFFTLNEANLDINLNYNENYTKIFGVSKDYFNALRDKSKGSNTELQKIIGKTFVTNNTNYSRGQLKDYQNKLLIGLKKVQDNAGLYSTEYNNLLKDLENLLLTTKIFSVYKQEGDTFYITLNNQFIIKGLAFINNNKKLLGLKDNQIPDTSGMLKELYNLKTVLERKKLNKIKLNKNGSLTLYVKDKKTTHKENGSKYIEDKLKKDFTVTNIVYLNVDSKKINKFVIAGINDYRNNIGALMYVKDKIFFLIKEPIIINNYIKNERYYKQGVLKGNVNLKDLSYSANYTGPRYMKINRDGLYNDTIVKLNLKGKYIDYMRVTGLLNNKDTNKDKLFLSYKLELKENLDLISLLDYNENLFGTDIKIYNKLYFKNLFKEGNADISIITKNSDRLNANIKGHYEYKVGKIGTNIDKIKKEIDNTKLYDAKTQQEIIKTNINNF